MLCRSGKLLQLPVELGQIDAARRSHKNFIVLGAAHLILLLVHHQFFVELLARTQTHDLDLHIHARLIAVKADELLGKIHDLDRLAHVQHIDIAALGQRTGLQHQLGRFRNGHKVALNVGIRQGNRPAFFDLGLKQRNDAAVAAQHIAKTHSHTLHIRVARKGLDEHFADALGTAHHTGGVHSLIGGKLHEPLHVVFAGAHQQIFGAQNIVLDRFCRADLHQRHMLVCCRMEHHSGMIGFKNLIQTLFIADGANEHRYRDIPAVLLLQLHQKLIGAVLVDIKNKQLAGLEAHHLTAQFAADGAAAARDQNGLAGEVAGDLIGIQRHFLAGKEVRRVQLAEGSLLRCTAAHQLRVTEQLHRTMGADAQIDDMVQLAALQGRNGDDDAVDAVALAQVRDILQRALHRHPVDGLVEFCGIIVHRHHRVTIFLIGFAHVDGPCTGFACTYDHHRAVGVLAGSAA